MGKLETIKIVDDNKRGFKTINKSTFDITKHKVYGVEEKLTDDDLYVKLKKGEVKAKDLGSDELKEVASKFKFEYTNKKEAVKFIEESLKEDDTEEL